MIIPKHYENFDVLHENTMPSRAYYIPASKRMNNLVEHREASDRIQMLNGNWKFRYYESVSEVTEEFYKEDYSGADYDEIPVPGVWQMYGCDTHQYTNIRYPFPFDPPYVPQKNPCGTYICEFMYQKNPAAPKAFLNFEGVDSCFYVWMNGEYAGYSQVSHSTSEFDITDKLREGKNVLAVLVLKWCDGSYLEDQDKFRMSGIFRDVYIMKRPKQAVRDYFIKTELRADTAKVSIQLEYFDEVIPTKISICDEEGNEIQKASLTSNEAAEESPDAHTLYAELSIPKPILWNTEAPYLYTLYIETKAETITEAEPTTESETITEHIGLREIKIIDRVVYFNGEKIKFRGVNRHDSDPVTGFTISIEQMMKDLTLMKRYNFNAIRTSHYPNSPVFCQLCDKYGFMVIDEADMECHGAAECIYEDFSEQNRTNHWVEAIADNPKWEASIVDRVQRCVQRDKNRPCVVIWSMGNESAYGGNFEKALVWTKSFDDTRLTHYEGAHFSADNRKNDYSKLDLHSRMYPSLEEIQDYIDSEPDKPYILCEYCHAMGNGPGDFEDYFELFHSNELLCGGFVWEWCDHAVYHGMTEEGKAIYYYGGDHGEVIHDQNFCMDGMVYPDRTPHTNMEEYKNVYRPARVLSYDETSQELEIRNYMDFTDLKDYADIRYEINCDGRIVKEGMLPAFSVKPHKTAKVTLNNTIPQAGKTYLKIYYYLKKEEALVPAGHLLGFDEIVLSNEDGRNQTALKWLEERPKAAKAAEVQGTEEQQKAAKEVEVQEKEGQVICRGSDFIYIYNKSTGMFEQMYYKGRQYLDKPMEVNIWRAPTDNDRNLKEEWKRVRYDQAYTRTYSTAVGQNRTGVVINSKMSVVVDILQPLMNMDSTWMIDSNGGITLKMAVERNTEFPDLPRFGIRLFLPNSMENVSYYGMGPFESYRDKCRGSSHGLYHAKVSELHEDYIRPQENGSHVDCDYVLLADGELGLAGVSANPFSFNASCYTQEELENKKHNFELEKSGSVILCLDYAQNGIGSNSCGPKVLEKYRLNDREFTFDIKLVPFAQTVTV